MDSAAFYFIVVLCAPHPVPSYVLYSKYNQVRKGVSEISTAWFFYKESIRMPAHSLENQTQIEGPDLKSNLLLLPMAGRRIFALKHGKNLM
jgi:hypothetical protein